MSQYKKKEISFLKTKNFHKNKKPLINDKRREDFLNENKEEKSSWLRFTCRTSNQNCLPNLVNELEEMLSKYVPRRIPLKAINPMYNDNRLDFHVELKKHDSKALYRNYYKIDNYDLKCLVLDNVSIPPILPENWKYSIEQALEKRFSKDQLSGQTVVDLSNFSNDSFLKDQGLLLKLSNCNVMKHVMDTLKEANLKSITKINFSNNDISNTSQLESFFEKCIVSEVDLSYNRLTRISDLSFMSKNNITALNVTCNYLMKKCAPRKIQDEIKKLLPKLISFNGRTLPASIVIAGDIPQPKKNIPATIYSDKNSNIHNFMLKYCQAFDNKIRDDLLDFYSTESVMSLVCYSEEMPYCYRSLNSNIKNNNSQNNFKKGKAEICATFTIFPKTKHILNSLNVDVEFSTTNDMMFTLTGVFIELPERSSGRYRARQFSRTFVINSNGIILQEHLSLMANDPNLCIKYNTDIENIRESNEFYEKYKEELKNLPTGALDVLKQFKLFTGMTIAACIDFLSLMNNLTEAMEKFTLMKEQGSIPREAYDHK